MSSWLPGLSILNAHQAMGAGVIPTPFTNPTTLRLYVVGDSGDVEVLEPESISESGIEPARWAAVESLLTPRFGHTVSVGFNAGINSLYVIGGRSSSGTLLSGVECYPYRFPKGGWTVVKPMPTARERPAAASTSEIIYVAGGSDGSTFETSSPLTTLESYEPSTNKWKTLKHMHTARDGAAAVTGPDGRIYVMGGYNNSGALKTMEAYDAATNSWANMPSMTTPRAGLGATVGFDGQLYAVGGNNGPETLSTVEVYNFTTEAWTLGPSISIARSNLAVATAPNALIYAIGGLTAFLGPTDSVEVLSSV